MEADRELRRVVRRSALLVPLTALAALSGCGGGGGADSGAQSPPPAADSTLPPAVSAAVKSAAAVPPEIMAADNAFGLQVLDTLVRQQASNTAISPTSLALALQIVYNGAAGTTQQAMAQTLQLGSLGTPQLNADNADLQAALLDPDPQTTLTIADSLWMHLDNNPVLPAFISINQTYYGATVGDLAGAPDNINAWVATSTAGLITSIVPPGDFKAVVAVIVNAIYFKGQWTGQMQDASLNLSLPRFATSFSAELAGSLSALGMSVAFGCPPFGEADFSRLAPAACITSVRHRTMIEVDETGTTAAGATGVIVGISAEPGLSMTMDRPFFYAVRDDQSGALLFIGALLDPTGP